MSFLASRKKQTQPKARMTSKRWRAKLFLRSVQDESLKSLLSVIFEKIASLPTQKNQAKTIQGAFPNREYSSIYSSAKR